MGAEKFPSKNPTISSMTIIPGSFCCSSSEALVARAIAEKIVKTKTMVAPRTDTSARRVKPKENGMAATVPTVPGKIGV